MHRIRVYCSRIVCPGYHWSTKFMKPILLVVKRREPWILTICCTGCLSSCKTSLRLQKSTEPASAICLSMNFRIPITCSMPSCASYVTTKAVLATFAWWVTMRSQSMASGGQRYRTFWILRRISKNLVYRYSNWNKIIVRLRTS